QKHAPPPAAATTTEAPGPAAPVPAANVVRLRPSGKKERIAGLVVGAAGLGALGAGIGLGVAALDAQNKLSQLATAMGNWSPTQADLFTNGQRDAAVATALYAVGGAAVATGVILYAVGVKKDRARFALAPLPGGGAQAVWSCAF